MKRLLILLLISILALSSCTSLNDIVNSENVTDTSGRSTDGTVSSTALSTSIQNSAISFLRESGFTVSGMALSDDEASAVYYVWADNYGNKTSLTLEDAEKLARDFCIENSLPENAITVEKGFYSFTQLGVSVEGISDEELSKKAINGDPAANAAQFLGQNTSDYDLSCENDKLIVSFKEGKTYSDLAESFRFIINEYLEHIIIE